MEMFQTVHFELDVEIDQVWLRIIQEKQYISFEDIKSLTQGQFTQVSQTIQSCW